MIKINDFSISFEPEIVKDARFYLPWLVNGPGISGRCASLRSAITSVLYDLQLIGIYGIPF